MSNFNIGGSGDLTDGTATLNVASISISSLTPSTTIKTDLSSKIISSAIDISDVSGLQTALDAAITNPYIGTLQATDFASDNVGSYDDKIPEIDGELLNKVSKTDTSDQSFVSNLTLTDDTKKISAVNIQTEEITTPNTYLNITGTISQTGDQYYIENTTVPANNFRINMLGASGTELQGRGGDVFLNSQTDKVIVQGTELEVQCPIKLNSTILDSNDNASYILKKGSGADSYFCGPNTFTGSGARNISIGSTIGHISDGGGENVLIGYGISTTAASAFVNTVVGDSAGNKLAGAANAFFGSRAGNVSTGEYNTCLGYRTGDNLTVGDYNTFVGSSAEGVATLNNQIGIGSNSLCSAANQCVIGDTAIVQVLSDGFRDLDVKTNTNVLAIGKTNATKVEIGKSGAITEVKGDLNIVNSGLFVYDTSQAGTKVREACIHAICNATDVPIKAESRAGSGAVYSMELMPYFRDLEGGIRVKGISSSTKLEIIQWDNGTGGAFSNLGRMRFNLLNADVQENQIEITTAQTTIKKDLVVSSTTASTNTTTGSIKTAGGLGVAGNLNVGGTFNGLTPIGGVFAQIATKTNTEIGAVSYVSLITTGVGSLTVPANTFKVGDTYSLKLSGVKTNGNNNQLTIRLVSGAVLLATTGAIILPSLSSAPYELEVEFTIRAIGGAGTAYIFTSGNIDYTDTGAYKGSNFNSINTTTFDTTISNTLDIEALQSTVSNIITCSQLVLTKIF